MVSCTMGGAGNYCHGLSVARPKKCISGGDHKCCGGDTDPSGAATPVCYVKGLRKLKGGGEQGYECAKSDTDAGCVAKCQRKCATKERPYTFLLGGSTTEKGCYCLMAKELLQSFDKGSSGDAWSDTHSWIDLRGCPKGEEAKCAKMKAGGQNCGGGPDVMCPREAKVPFAFDQGSLWLTNDAKTKGLPDLLAGKSCREVCEGRFPVEKECLAYMESAKYESCLIRGGGGDLQVQKITDDAQIAKQGTPWQQKFDQLPGFPVHKGSMTGIPVDWSVFERPGMACPDGPKKFQVDTADRMAWGFGFFYDAEEKICNFIRPAAFPLIRKLRRENSWDTKSCPTCVTYLPRSVWLWAWQPTTRFPEPAGQPAHVPLIGFAAGAEANEEEDESEKKEEDDADDADSTTPADEAETTAGAEADTETPTADTDAPTAGAEGETSLVGPDAATAGPEQAALVEIGGGSAPPQAPCGDGPCDLLGPKLAEEKELSGDVLTLAATKTSNTNDPTKPWSFLDTLFRTGTSSTAGQRNELTQTDAQSLGTTQMNEVTQTDALSLGTQLVLRDADADADAATTTTTEEEKNTVATAAAATDAATGTVAATGGAATGAGDETDSLVLDDDDDSDKATQSSEVIAIPENSLSLKFHPFPGWSQTSNAYVITSATEDCNLEEFLQTLEDGAGFYYDWGFKGGFCLKVDVGNVGTIKSDWSTKDQVGRHNRLEHQGPGRSAQSTGAPRTR